MTQIADNELADVRTIPRDISEECGGDPDRVFDYYEQVQKRIEESGRFEFVEEPIRSVRSLVEHQPAINR